MVSRMMIRINRRYNDTCFEHAIVWSVRHAQVGSRGVARGNRPNSAVAGLQLMSGCACELPDVESKGHHKFERLARPKASCHPCSAGCTGRLDVALAQRLFPSASRMHPRCSNHQRYLDVVETLRWSGLCLRFALSTAAAFPSQWGAESGYRATPQLLELAAHS